MRKPSESGPGGAAQRAGHPEQALVAANVRINHQGEAPIEKGIRGVVLGLSSLTIGQRTLFSKLFIDEPEL